MSKTCRTCKRLYPQWRCTHHHVYTDPSETCEFHESYESRETPLLVDALAMVTRALMVELSHARDRHPGRLCDEDCLEWARRVLARHQKEVGDA